MSRIETMAREMLAVSLLMGEAEALAEIKRMLEAWQTELLSPPYLAEDE